ncbi:MAG: Plug domain-containing protein, partial [Bacteroidota bacterium]|nr:Plug domain-containing protein [Bacteroidota bacterium]
YVFDAKNSKLDTNKQLIFVELISPNKKIIYVKKYFVKKGVSWGNIFLPDSLTNGVYQLRTYTNSMKNFPSEFFFSKNIFINSAYKKYSPEYYRLAKKAIRKKKKIDINYKIEGGNIIAGLNCKIAFHILDTKNDNSDNTVYITDNKRNIVVKKKNTSINNLTFVPKYGEKYFLVIKSKNRRKTKIKLPKVEKHGVIIRKNVSNDIIELEIHSNKPKSNDSLSRTYILLGESNGKIHYLKYIKVDTLTKINISNSKIRVETCNFLLINVKNEIIASLPVSNLNKKNKNNFKITSNYQNDTLTVIFSSNNKINGNFSISIMSEKSKSINIIDYFSLYAETPFLLRNYSELNIDDSNTSTFLNLYYKDKYSIAKIIKNDIDETTYKPLRSISISGEIKFLKEQIVAKYGKLSLSILNTFNDSYNTVANEKGEFSFDNLNYTTDSIKFMINAVSKNNKKKIIILIDEYDTSKIFFNPFITEQSLKIKRRDIERDINYKKLESKSKYNFHPDQIISGEELQRSGFGNILETLDNRIRGLKSPRNTASFNNAKSGIQPQDPLYLLDDVPVSKSIIATINPVNVDQVELIGSAAEGLIAGQNGINGVIAVFTKYGENIEWGVLNGSITGISKPLDFFQAKEITKYHTYKWIPNLEIESNKYILKIPIKIKEEANIVIQGFSNNSPVFFTRKIN